jgi:hypothetical protein
LIKQPYLAKVFLALRTNFIPELRDEHITLAYFQEIRWDALLDIAEKYDKMLPATIQIYGKMTWKGFDGGEYHGFDVNSWDSNILRMLKMPHITVPKHILDMIKPIDLEPVEVVDRLYLGKKINGQLVWATVKSDQIGPGHAALNWGYQRDTNIGEEP